MSKVTYEYDSEHRAVMFPTLTAGLMLKKLLYGENLMLIGERAAGKTHTLVI